MSYSLNKVLLIGNLGADAETSYTQNSNTPITKFRLATTRSYKKNDEWVNETEWHRITAFNLPEYIQAALKKGAKVYVDGRLTYNEYVKDDQKIRFTDIIANEIILLDKSTKSTSNTPIEPFAGENNTDANTTPKPEAGENNADTDTIPTPEANEKYADGNTTFEPEAGKDNKAENLSFIANYKDIGGTNKQNEDELPF